MRDNSNMWERFENEGLKRGFSKKKTGSLKQREGKKIWELSKIDVVRNREPGNYVDGKLWEKEQEIKDPKSKKDGRTKISVQRGKAK